MWYFNSTFYHLVTIIPLTGAKIKIFSWILRCFFGISNILWYTCFLHTRGDKCRDFLPDPCSFFSLLTQKVEDTPILGISSTLSSISLFNFLSFLFQLRFRSGLILHFALLCTADMPDNDPHNRHNNKKCRKRHRYRIADARDQKLVRAQ